LHAGIPPANRPGIPPVIITWADPAYLADFCKDIAALRPKVDILVAANTSLRHSPSRSGAT